MYSRALAVYSDRPCDSKTNSCKRWNYDNWGGCQTGNEISMGSAGKKDVREVLAIYV